MIVLQSKSRRKLWLFGQTLVLASVLFYFSYHMISGEKGVLSMIQLEQKLAAANEELAQVEARRQRLENRVSLLYTTSLDPDLLDEQARKNLGRAGTGEIVYMPEAARRAK